jgi:hypothetical protein
VAGFGFIVELAFLAGRAVLSPYDVPVAAIVSFNE